ncbi:MAG: HlyD family efflux transporter periplasmic adaptor subunit [Rubripirellula sp.]|nr:HlyD family efflux transporter periplasmic adaptor subunit [Rubripirellula sp.]
MKHIITIVLLAWITPASLSAQENELERRIEETVRELGVLESSSGVEIRSPVESTVLSVVPEGAEVKRGDSLLNLDVSRLEDERSQQRIKLAESDAELIGILTKTDAIERESKARAAMSELAVKVSELELQRFVAEDGELAFRKQEIETGVALAQEQLKTTQQVRQLTAAAVKSGTLGADKSSALVELAVIEAKANLAVAEAKRNWFQNHVRGHESAALQLALLQAKLMQTKGTEEFGQRFAKAQADSRTAEAARDAEQAKLNRLEKMLAACQIKSPIDGVVLYSITTNGRGMQAPAIETGAAVQQRQLILRVVDMKRLQVRVLVNQSRISRVRLGQPAEIRFDAVPNKTLEGKVLKISRIPEPAAWSGGNVKRYAVEVSINNPSDYLRLGMTAVVEINTAGEVSARSR